VSTGALVAVVLVVSGCAAAPDTTRAWRAVDLDRPGAMATLERENPEHFAKVQRIRGEARGHPLESLPDWLRGDVGARDIEGLQFVMPGQGAQTRLTFALDQRTYTMLLRVQ